MNSPTRLSCAEFRVRRRLAGRALINALLVFVTAALAQPGLAASPAAQAEFTRRKNLRAEALSAFKRGDTAGGLAQIDQIPRSGSGKPHLDVQAGLQLAIVCGELKTSGDYARTRAVAALANGRLAQPQGRMNAKDAVAALVLSAEIREHFGADPAGAIVDYQAALTLDPTHEHAAQRLNHLKAIEEIAALKAAGNALLRQRAIEAKQLSGGR